MEGDEGWRVRNAHRDRLQGTQGGEGAGKRLRLDVRLEDSITGCGVRADDTVTRERRTLRARYQLVDSASGAVLLDATAAQDAGIDVVAANMRRLPPNRRRSNGSPRASPTRSSRASRSMRTAAAASRGRCSHPPYPRPPCPHPPGNEERQARRSEERRVGKECVSPCSSRGSPYH